MSRARGEGGTANSISYALFRVAAGVAAFTLVIGLSGVSPLPAQAADYHISVSKKVSPTTVENVGDKVTYTITIVNDGNGSLFNLDFYDTFSGSGTFFSNADPLNKNNGMKCTRADGANDKVRTDLDVGIPVTCTYTYTMTAADIAKGLVTNTVYVGACQNNGNNCQKKADQYHLSSPTSIDDATVIVPGMELTKTGTLNTAGAMPKPGDTITFDYVVTNIKQNNLNQGSLREKNFTGTGGWPMPSCSSDTLGPAGSATGQLTCTATYTITQADIDAGQVTNTADAKGCITGTSTCTFSKEATAVVPIPQVAKISASKSGQLQDLGGKIVAPGDKIDYTVDVTNTGNVKLTSVRVEDTLLGAGGMTCAATELAAHASTKCTGSYAVTQADIDAGQVDNTATAYGTSATQGVVDDTDSATTGLDQVAAITVTKTGQMGPAAHSPVRVGDPVDFRVLVKNTGNVAVTGAVVSDAFLPGLTCGTGLDRMEPGAEVECTGTHAVTPAEFDAGKVVNTAAATATGTDLNLTPVHDEKTATVDFPEVAAMDVAKSGWLAGDPAVAVRVGDTAKFKVVVTNEGNVPLTSVVVDDSLLGDKFSCPVGPVPVGGELECTGDYVLTKADLDRGYVTNTATVTATGNGGPVTAADTARVDLSWDPKIKVTKSGNLGDAAHKPVKVGDPVEFEALVENTGNVTLKGIAWSDDIVPLSCPKTTLDAGDSMTCTGTYALQQSDINNEQVTNTVHVTGFGPDGTTSATDEDSTDVTLDWNVDLSVKKTGVLAPTGKPPQAGDKIDYTIEVQNTGNVDLRTVDVTDDKLDPKGASCPDTTLLAGESMECAGTYLLTPAEINRGWVTNNVTVVGTDLNGGTIQVGDQYTVELTQAPKLEVTKTGELGPSPHTRPEAGDPVVFDVEVQNTGNVTLDLTVNDPLLPGLACPSSLPAGETVTCTGTYLLQPADINKGQVTNTVTVTGTGPNGDKDADTKTAVVPLNRVVGIHVTKTGSLGDDAHTPPVAGDPVDFHVVIQNTGNVGLDPVVPADDKLPGDKLKCSDTWLPAGQETECTGTYKLTQADIDAGHVTNEVTVEGKTLDNQTKDARAEADVMLTRKPEFTVEKTGRLVGDPAVAPGPGDKVAYEVLVTNTGNVTLDPVTVTDDKTGGPMDCPKTKLARGDDMICTGEYALTGDDIDAGLVTNIVAVTGTGTNGESKTRRDNTTVGLNWDPGIKVTKTGVLEVPQGQQVNPGDKISFTAIVQNTGNVSLNPVVLDDPLMAPDKLVCEDSWLPAGGKTTCTGSYTLTKGDINIGSVRNTVTATGIDPQDKDWAGTDSVDVPLTHVTQVSVSKVGWLPDGAHDPVEAGDPVVFEVTVKNTGNVTLDPVEVSDPTLVDGLDCPLEVLEAAEFMACTGIYRLTAADIDAGRIINEVSVTVTGPDGSKTVGASAPVDLGWAPNFTVEKTGYLGPTDHDDPMPGDLVLFDVTVKNTGNVTLDTLETSDLTLDADLDCPSRSLPAGSPPMICHGQYTLTQADIDAGEVWNEVSVTASGPDHEPFTKKASTTVTLDREAAMSVEKSGRLVLGGADAQAGDKIIFTVDVKNTGNVSLTNIDKNDPLVPGLLCQDTWLAAGKSTTCTGTYTLTQGDVDAGEVTNTVSVTGTTPTGDKTLGDSATVTLDRHPHITVTKTGNLASSADSPRPGDLVDFTVVVTNAGNVTLETVAVDDPLLGAALDCPASSLAVGADMTCTGRYALKPADVNAGTVRNIVTATGTAPGGLTDTAQDDISVSLARLPGISVDKNGVLAPGHDPVEAGDKVNFTVTITNTGNVGLNPVTWTDSMLADPPNNSPLLCQASRLASGESMTCYGDYTLTQADIDNGAVLNRIDVEGRGPAGLRATAGTTAPVNLHRDPDISVEKTGRLGAGAAGAMAVAGDPVDYTVTITNTGNVTLDNLTWSDPGLPDLSCPQQTKLGAGKSIICTGTHDLTKEDMQAAATTNKVYVSATGPDGAETKDDSTATVLITREPSLDVAKSAAAGLGAGEHIKEGDPIDFTVRVSNTGNVALNPVIVTDPLLDGATPGSGLSCQRTSLPPGVAMDCTGTYLLTQDDLDAGGVRNEVFVTGTDVSGTTVNGGAFVVARVDREPELTVKKTGKMPDGHTPPAAGDEVVFDVVVSNTGNVTVTDIVPSDQMPGVGLTCPKTKLAAGTSMTCSGTYTLTTADVNRGSVSNTVKVAGKGANGKEVSGGDATTVTVDRKPGLSVEKTGVLGFGAHTPAQAGDPMDFTVVVLNTGNVALNSFAVTDDLLDGDTPGSGLTCDRTRLRAGATMTCAGTYYLTPEDVDAGGVENTAAVVGKDPDGKDVLGGATIWATVDREPSILVTKTGQLGAVHTPLRVGDPVEFTFVVENTGNVKLDPVTVTDSLVGVVSCPRTSLAAGTKMTCTATHGLTRGELNAGAVRNDVSVSGTGPAGDTATDTDATSVSLTQAPGLSVTKTGVVPGVHDLVEVGDPVSFTVTVQNTGNVSLNPVAVTDSQIGDMRCSRTGLPAGFSMTCTGVYAVTQADIDRGFVDNTVDVVGVGPDGEPVPGHAVAQVDLDREPAISLAMSGWLGSPNDKVLPGDPVVFQMVVKNTGNVTLTDVDLTDLFAATGLGCPHATLLPGSSMICTRTYALTRADIDAGFVEDKADVVGTGPNGKVVTDDNKAKVTLDWKAGIFATKSGHLGSDTGKPVAAGDPVVFTMTVENTGNTSLNPLRVDDPLLGPEGMVCEDSWLPAGASTACEGVYKVTPGDINAGFVQNAATAVGTEPDGTLVSYPATAVVRFDWDPSVKVEKSGHLGDGAHDPVRVGDPVDWEVLVINDGNVTLDPLTVSDPLLDPDGLDCPFDSLDAGQEMTCTGTSNVTPQDIGDGVVWNKVYVNATSPKGRLPVVAAVADVELKWASKIEVTKSGRLSATAGKPVRAGDLVDFAVEVKNSGNVTLDQVEVLDLLLDASGGLDCPGTVLAAGDSMSCEGSYPVTQADIDAGEVVNRVWVTGRGPDKTVTDNSSTSVPLSWLPGISVSKSGRLGDAAHPVLLVGDPVDYTVVVKNTGNVTLTSVAVTDPLLGAGGVVCPGSVLVGGESMECTGTYAITAADLDAGSVVNTASATGLDPDKAEWTAGDQWEVPLDRDPHIMVTKAGWLRQTGNGDVRAGDKVDFDITITNTGNVTVDSFEITDGLLKNAVDCPQDSLPAGESMTCSGTYTLTTADVNRGSVSNTVRVTGKGMNGQEVSADDSTTVTIDRKPGLSVSKTGVLGLGAHTPAEPGDPMDFTVVVQNTGNVALGPVTVVDPLLDDGVPGSGLSCNRTWLSAGRSMTCTGTYYLTEDDVDAGGVENTATVAGKAPDGKDVPGGATIWATVDREPSISVTKTGQLGDAQTPLRVGDLVDFSFVVENTGNVKLDPVTVTDSLVGVVSCPRTSLAAGANMTCTATHGLTRGELNAGAVRNDVSVSGQGPAGDKATDTDATSVPLTQTPGLSVTKTGVVPPVNDPVAAGDPVNFTVTVQNTGNVSLNPVGVTDSQIGDMRCSRTGLPAGFSMTCTGVYHVTQADVDRGFVDNVVDVRGIAPDGKPVPGHAVAQVDLDREPAISLAMSGWLGSPNDTVLPGDPVVFQLVVKNTGNVTLTDVYWADLVLGTGLDCPYGTLLPGQSMICTGAYALTRADIDAGFVEDKAQVAGTGVNGKVVDDNAVARVRLDWKAGILATKSGHLGSDTGKPVAAGDPVVFTMTVENTGNTSLNPLRVDDPLLGPEGMVCEDSWLPAGASTACEGVYKVTPGDINAGFVQNVATAVGTEPGGPLVSYPATAVVRFDWDPSVKVEKSGHLGDGAHDPVRVGDPVDWEVLVINDGNVTLDPVKVSDPWLDPDGLDCPFDVLDAGARMTCTGTSYVTPADINDGVVWNRVTVNATGPNGRLPVVGSAADVELKWASKIEVIKSGRLSATAGKPVRAGDLVDFTVEVKNSGNVTLDPVEVSDPLLDASGGLDCPVTVLAAGESMDCRGSYPVTQANINAGEVVNRVWVTGRGPDKTVTDNSSTSVSLSWLPGISVSKSGRLVGGNTPLQIGDPVEFTVLVKNTGNVTLTSVAATDTLLGADGLVCPATVLQGGESMECAGTYAITAADLDAGEVVNTASATGLDPDKVEWTAGDQRVVPLDRDPHMMVTKAGRLVGDTQEPVRSGDLVDFDVMITNTGNVTLDSFEIADPLLNDAVDCPSDSVPAGQTMTCTGTYTLKPGDINAGSVSNTVMVTGYGPGHVPVSDGFTTAVPLTAAPGMTVSKTGWVSPAPDSPVQAGDLVQFAITVQNSGNVAEDPVVVSDLPLGATLACPETWLPAGATMTCTGSYPLSQADVDSGGVRNTVTVTGTPPGGEPITAGDTTVVGLDQSPKITVTKAGRLGPDPHDPVAPGDTLDFDILVRNTGNVTLDPVVVSDPPLGTSLHCPSESLAAGTSMVCTGSYTLTTGNVNAGFVSNTVDVYGTGPDGDRATDGDTIAVPLARVSGMSVVKTGWLGAGAGDPVMPGDPVEFQVVVQNTGNVALSPVGATDPSLPELSCPSTWLEGGASMTCSGTHHVTAADVDAGVISNKVTVHGEDPDGTPVDVGGSTQVELKWSPGITVSKAGRLSHDAHDPVVAGDSVEFAVTVRNSGNVTLDPVVVSDPGLPNLDCPSGSLDAGASMICTGSRVLTPADVNRGTVTNEASATGTEPTGATVTDGAAAEVRLDWKPGMEVTKSGRLGQDAHDPVIAGDTVEFQVVVVNTGNVAVTPVDVSDSLLGSDGLSCPDTWLPGGASMTCTGSYTVTGADVDAGEVANTASAAGIAPDGAPVPAGGTTVVTLEVSPGIGVTKYGQLDPAHHDPVMPGDKVNFSVVVENTGGVTLHGVTVADAMVPGMSCPSDTLAVRASMTCTGSYTLTPDDIRAGEVTNTATAEGLSPRDQLVSATSRPAAVAVGAVPRISLTKTADPDVYDHAGQAVAYSFVVENTGNVPLTHVAVSDPKVGTVTCGQTTLAVGEEITCAGTYVITQADVDAGQVENYALVTGLAPDGVTTATADSQVEIYAKWVVDAPLFLSKTVRDPSADHAGQVVVFDLVVTNNSNVTVTGVGIDETGIMARVPDGLTRTADIQLCHYDQVNPVHNVSTGVHNGDAILAPGESWICQASFTVTQRDLDNQVGGLTNYAVATGTQGAAAVTSNEAWATETIVSRAAMRVAKQADKTDVKAGDYVTYTFTLENLGNTDLSYGYVDDGTMFTGTGPWTGKVARCVSSDPGRTEQNATTMLVIAPGETLTCTFPPYLVTTQDAAAGTLTNKIKVTATPTGGGEPIAGEAGSKPVKVTPVEPQPRPPAAIKSGGTASGSGPSGAAALLLVLAGTTMMVAAVRRRRS